MAVSRVEDVSEKKKLEGSLGVWAIVFMVVATAAPLTVMVANTPLIISMGNGAAAPFDALIGTIIMLLFTVGFVAMTPHITNAGAFYAYIQKGLGRIVGLGSATLALFSYFCILVALEAYIGYAIGDFLKSIVGVSVPWQILSLLVVAIVGVLGYRDVELSAKFLGVALVLEITVVLLVNLVIIATHARGGIDLTPFSSGVIKSGSPGLGIMFAIYSFVGFEATVVFREEARDPDVTIPRATYAAVLIIGAFYVISMWCEVVGVGVGRVMDFATQHPADIYLLLAEQYVGSSVHNIMQVLLLTSLFACILSLHNIVVRYKYVLGRYGILHSSLAKVHLRHGSPHVSSVVQTVMSLAAIVMLGAIGLSPVTQIYAWGATAGTIGYMVIISLTCISIFVFFSKNRRNQRILNVRVAPALGFFGLAGCLVIAIMNLPALIGGDDAPIIAKFMLGVIVLAFVVGAMAATLLRTRSPSRFEGLRELA
ncbi:APC family permease [Paraburkholderia sediminicola]|uniref:APC family permease n=1 Tax=Paraburkholderia sediminicola TaxID=458836 RepID=UPI0038BB5AC0